MSSVLEINPSEWDDPQSWDKDWADEWLQMRKIFLKIEELKQLFDETEVPLLYRLSQKQVILNLEKYACSLSKIIANKYN